MGINIGKNIKKDLISKYSKKFLDHTKQSATDALCEKVIQKDSRNNC